MELDPSGLVVLLRARGTNSEALLKAHTASPQQLLRCHVCPKGCGLQESGDYFLHLLKGRKGKPAGEEEWTTNLDAGGVAAEHEDEMAGLRRKADALRQPQEQAPGGGTPIEDLTRGEGHRQEKSLSPDKSRKKKKEEEGEGDGRGPLPRSSMPERSQGPVRWDRFRSKREGEEA